VYRLGAILLVFFVAAAFARQWATPDSWNYEGWFREDAVVLALEQPLVYGGNDSCVACHEEVSHEFQQLPHRGLSCESCHGALADHVVADAKVAEAPIDKSNSQCLNCHAPQISKPADFPQFTMQVYMHEGHKETTLCLECHRGHDPNP
jgi:hypothetical protein